LRRFSGKRPLSSQLFDHHILFTDSEHIGLMYLFKTTDALENYLTQVRESDRSIGFAPTMGALHKGHLRLFQRAKAETNCVVSSIFVNPTQFNEASDLEKYPRLPEKDIPLLVKEGVEVLFMPTVEEMYPPDLPPLPNFDFGQLTKVLEGQHRPGHFEGVIQVMHRLLTLVQPDRLYMGQKDFQQFTIIQSLIQQMNSPTVLVPVPTMRAEDGLAMSSRNLRLNPDERQRAPLLFQTLQWAKEQIGQLSIAEIELQAVQQLETEGFQVEYFTLADAQTLQAVKMLDEVEKVVACTAAWLGNVRLIDNMMLKGKL